MDSYAMTISCKLNESDENKTVIILDQVYDNNITDTSNITTHPLANGDIVADHMYNDPLSMSFRGIFSLNGSKGLIVDGNGTRFEDLQELFEKIKNNGLLCDIVKVQLVDKNDGTQIPKFKIRRNMVLDAIQWLEKINTLEFTFNFTQVLIADIQEENIDPTDPYLPITTNPKTLNFTDTLINWTDVDKILNSELVNKKVVDVKFFDVIASQSTDNLIALGISVATVTAMVLASNPVGWVVGGVVLVITAVSWIITSIVNLFKKKNERKKLFQVYKDPNKMNEEIKKYAGFVERFHKQLESLNLAIQVFSLSKDEEQECLLTIDNGYYDFMFKKNNTNNTYNLTITDSYNNDALVKIVNDISGSPAGINDCNNSNKLFITQNSNNYVYLLLPEFIIEYENGIEVNSKSDASNLTHYYLVTSTFNLEEYTEKLTEVISTTLETLI